MGFKNMELPKYTLGEELISSISHGVGVIFGIAALVVGVVYAVMYGTVLSVVSMAVYGTTLIFMYTASTVYHSLSINAGKKVFRILDHCCIFLLIAGTYTPYTLLTLAGVLGWVLFGIVWGAAVVGIVLNAIDIKKFSIFSMICYLAMGWVIIFAIKPLFEALNKNGIILLIVGGVLYTIGAIIYGFGKKIKFFHSIWHLFVLAGSVLHFLSILLYVVIK